MLKSKTELDTTEMEGLVLIDEIDLYLHPTWQARFIPALRRVFPRMQFVATTHSPAVLSALAPHEVVRLAVDPRAETSCRVAGRRTVASSSREFRTQSISPTRGS